MAKSAISNAPSPSPRSTLHRPVSTSDRVVALIGASGALLDGAGGIWTLATDFYGRQNIEMLTGIVVVAFVAALLFLIARTMKGRWLGALSLLAPATGLALLLVSQSIGAFAGVNRTPSVALNYVDRPALNFATRPALWIPLVMLSRPRMRMSPAAVCLLGAKAHRAGTDRAGGHPERVRRWQFAHPE